MIETLVCTKILYDLDNKPRLYMLRDSENLYHVMQPKKLIAGIRKGDFYCTNLRMINGKTLILTEEDKAVRKTDNARSAVERYNAYIMRQKLMGIKSDAVYEVSGEDVILKRVFVKNGIFIIQDFVTKIGCTVDYVSDFLIPITPLFQGAEEIQVINYSDVEDMSGLFASCEARRIDLTNFDTSKVTCMYGMFNACKAEEILGLENFDTSNVTCMHSMFMKCHNLVSLDVSHFNTSKVLDFCHMFDSDENLECLDVSHFNTSLAIDMSFMFCGCEKLCTLDVSHFDTSHVKYFDGMFERCFGLEHLDLSHFDLSIAETFADMFNSCSHLESIVWSGCVAHKLESASFFVTQCSNMRVLDLSFIDDKVVIKNWRSWFGTHPFHGCENLEVVYFNFCFEKRFSRWMKYLIKECKKCSPKVSVQFK